jgi:hypothetical protein
MELLPRDRHRFPGLQVFHAPHYLLVPSLHRAIRRFKTIEQRVSQSGALVDGEDEWAS